MPDPPLSLRVLVLEDDQALRERVLLPRLRDFGFAPSGAKTVEELFERIAARMPDIVVVDVGLPDGDGYTVTERLRSRSAELGIVMLTARGDTPDRVRGLSLGADAYLAKPVEIDLLAATLHTLARRLRGGPPAQGVWSLAEQGWSLVSPSGKDVALSKTERKLLARLAQSPGEVVDREELIAALTGNVHEFDPHRLESLIYRLRRKVERLTGQALPLAAVQREGYVLTSFA